LKPFLQSGNKFAAVKFLSRRETKTKQRQKRTDSYQEEKFVNLSGQQFFRMFFHAVFIINIILFLRF